MNSSRILERLFKPPINLFDEIGFSTLLDHLSITVADIGARGKITADLLPMARSVIAFGFEPDPEEFKRLQTTVKSSPWKETIYLPVAVGSEEKEVTLNVYSEEGCSSLLNARKDMGASFSRSDYYDLARTVNVPMSTLDSVVQKENLPFPDHIKVDVQGGELEVFKGASDCLKHALAVRTEVSFFPQYQDQPLFADIDSFLRNQGFVTMGFLESHAWRRTTKKKWPRRTKGSFPYSRGQLIHGDALYLRWPEDLPEETSEEKDKRLKLGLIASAFQFIDHAKATLTTASMLDYGKDSFDTDLEKALSNLSRRLGRYPKRIRDFIFP